MHLSTSGWIVVVYVLLTVTIPIVLFGRVWRPLLRFVYRIITHRCLPVLIVLIIFFQPSHARYRRHHARPEIHRSVRPDTRDTDHTRQCHDQTWVEGTALSYPNITGSTIADMKGTPWTWYGRSPQ